MRVRWLIRGLELATVAVLRRSPAVRLRTRRIGWSKATAPDAFKLAVLLGVLIHAVVVVIAFA